MWKHHGPDSHRPSTLPGPIPDTLHNVMEAALTAPPEKRREGTYLRQEKEVSYFATERKSSDLSQMPGT